MDRSFEVTVLQYFVQRLCRDVVGIAAPTVDRFFNGTWEGFVHVPEKLYSRC